MAEIAGLLEQLAGQLGVTVDYLWPLLVKQTVYDWWGWFLATLIAAVAAGIISKKLLTMGANYNAHGDMDAAYFIGGGIFGIASAILSICFVECISHISMVFVPEAATIERLLELL